MYLSRAYLDILTRAAEDAGAGSWLLCQEATGHIGTYLVPQLVDGGHEVIAVSRCGREPYHPNPQWNAVTRVTADCDAEDAAGTFGVRIAALRPDAVIDLICFTAASAGQPLALPDRGLGVLHHVHADDVAQAFELALSRRAGAGPAGTTREHTDRSITASIDRARQVLGYAPRYSSLDALHEALTWLVAHDQADVGGQRF
jgi:nucleoside-diphosphate-sugar epimerase